MQSQLKIPAEQEALIALMKLCLNLKGKDGEKENRGGRDPLTLLSSLPVSEWYDESYIMHTKNSTYLTELL